MTVLLGVGTLQTHFSDVGYRSQLVGDDWKSFELAARLTENFAQAFSCLLGSLADGTPFDFQTGCQFSAGIKVAFRKPRSNAIQFDRSLQSAGRFCVVFDFQRVKSV